MNKIRVYEDFNDIEFEEYTNDHAGIRRLFQDLTENYWKWEEDDKWFGMTVQSAFGNDKEMMDLILERQFVDNYKVVII